LLYVSISYSSREIGTIVRSLGLCPSEAELRELLLEVQSFFATHPLKCDEEESTGYIKYARFEPALTRIIKAKRFSSILTLTWQFSLCIRGAYSASISSVPLPLLPSFSSLSICTTSFLFLKKVTSNHFVKIFSFQIICNSSGPRCRETRSSQARRFEKASYERRFLRL
jgi:hypothetical protein